MHCKFVTKIKKKRSLLFFWLLEKSVIFNKIEFRFFFRFVFFQLIKKQRDFDLAEKDFFKHKNIFNRLEGVKKTVSAETDDLFW